MVGAHGTVHDPDGTAARTDGAVASLRAAGDVTDAAGQQLGRLIAGVREAIRVGDGGAMGYVVGSLGEPGCGLG